MFPWQQLSGSRQSHWLQAKEVAQSFQLKEIKQLTKISNKTTSHLRFFPQSIKHKDEMIQEKDILFPGQFNTLMKQKNISCTHGREGMLSSRQSNVMPDTRKEPTPATSGLLYTQWYHPQASKPSALAKPTSVDSYSNGEHLRPRRKARPARLHRPRRQHGNSVLAKTKLPKFCHKNPPRMLKSLLTKQSSNHK